MPRTSVAYLRPLLAGMLGLLLAACNPGNGDDLAAAATDGPVAAAGSTPVEGDDMHNESKQNDGMQNDSTGKGEMVDMTGGPGSCDAGAARELIGEEASPEVVSQALKLSGAQVSRTIEPGQAVTLEYNNNRVNLILDENMVITDVTCG